MSRTWTLQLSHLLRLYRFFRRNKMRLCCRDAPEFSVSDRDSQPVLVATRSRATWLRTVEVKTAALGRRVIPSYPTKRSYKIHPSLPLPSAVRMDIYFHYHSLHPSPLKPCGLFPSVQRAASFLVRRNPLKVHVQGNY